MIGIIIPPAEVKKLVQTTAQHVALNGSEFEKILIEREQHKPEFAFLKIDSPYRPYYDHRVAEISKKLLQGMSASETAQGEPAQQPMPEVQNEAKQEVAEQQQLLDKIFFELKEPDPEKYTAEIPQKLSEAEQAIILHTAQYSARNGRNFLIALSERQKNNPQFQFLRPSSKNNPYFIKAMTAYTNLLEMQESEIGRLQDSALSKQETLKRCRQTYDYYHLKQQQSRGKKEPTAKQVKESNVDWNDFELVETIGFDTDHKNINNGELLARIQQNAALQPKSMQETIIAQPKKREILQQCHACRQNILASEMNKHLKTCLAQKKKKVEVQPFQGEQVDITRNLQQLSSKRPDIFGTRENSILRDERDEQKEERVVYDGQAPNLSRTTGSLAMLHYQQRKLKEESQPHK